MTGSILKFHYKKFSSTISLISALISCWGITWIMLSNPKNLRTFGVEEAGGLSNLLLPETIIGFIIHYGVIAFFLWGCYFLSRQTIGFFTVLKGGTVPAVAFGTDHIDVATPFGQYRLKRSDIAYVKMRWAGLHRYPSIVLNQPSDHRTLFGFNLKKIDITLSLKGIRNRQLADAICKWKALEIFAPAESFEIAPKPEYGVAAPEGESLSVWTRQEPSISKTSQQKQLDLPSEGSVVRPHRSGKRLFGRKNVTA